MLKKYVVYKDYINNEPFYIICVKTAFNPLRIKVLGDFDTYKEANEYVDYLQHPEDYFDSDD